MNTVIELKDGKVETILDEGDFLDLIAEYMGQEAKAFLLELLADTYLEASSKMDELEAKYEDLQERYDELEQRHYGKEE